MKSIYKQNKKIDMNLLSGQIAPRSASGSGYIKYEGKIHVLTWNGAKEWESVWRIENGESLFLFIKTPLGTVVNLAGTSYKKFVPRRHFDIIERIRVQEVEE